MYNKTQFSDQLYTTIPARRHYDHIVIGSGPGGAITGCMLAEAGRDVLVLEEGGYFDLDDIEPFSIEEMKHKYRNGGLTLAFGKIKINYVEGKCVGGGSEVNSGLYHRTPKDVLAAWRNDFQLKDADEESLEPFFQQCEKDVCISYNPGVLSKASLKLAEGAEKKGWSQQEVPRWFSYSGKMDAEGQAEGVKMSMTQTYLPRMMKAGGRLMPQTRVLKIVQTGGHQVIHCEHQGQRFDLTCKHCFVCAGAVQTPQILHKSGLGKHIGERFLLHPTIKVTALFKEEVNRESMGVPVHQVKEFAPRFSFGCSISTPPYLAMAMTDHPNSAELVNTVWKKMAIYYAMTNAAGKGAVKALPVYKDPLVQYGITQEEKQHLAEGLKKLCELLFAAGAEVLYPSIAGSSPLHSMEDVNKLPASIPAATSNLMTIHLFSSCPMGENRHVCATDSYGKLHGVEGLYINDASLLPTALGVNPQGTVMAFALRNIDHFIKHTS